jgi:hypothetical protein
LQIGVEYHQSIAPDVIDTCANSGLFAVVARQIDARYALVALLHGFDTFQRAVRAAVVHKKDFYPTGQRSGYFVQFCTKQRQTFPFVINRHKDAKQCRFQWLDVFCFSKSSSTSSLNSCFSVSLSFHAYVR